jgi:phospholipid transport system substrate-binding protein
LIQGARQPYIRAFNRSFYEGALLKKLCLLVAALMTISSGQAYADAAGAEKFVDSMAQKAIGFLGDEALSQEQRKKEFNTLLQHHFDLDTIGRFALGRYWAQATPAQQKEYLRLFNKMVIEVYSRRFDEYKGQDVQVKGSRADGEKDMIVKSVIVPDEGAEVSVDWRVRNKGGSYKIIDVIVEGVSMAVTQRSDFASVIQRGGGKIDVLIEHLKSGKAPAQAAKAQEASEKKGE